MGTSLKRTQCPRCKDKGRDNHKDNLVTFGDGVYCFSCGYAGSEDRKERTPEGCISGEYRDIPNRGISEETCRKWGYQIGYHHGVQVHIANYKDKFGAVVAQKLRSKDKSKMPWRGDTAKAELYGQELWSPSPKMRVLVVEGELDALSVYEAVGRTIAVVSVKCGAGTAKKEIQENLEWLNGFSSVYIGLDADDDGRDAMKQCVDLFEPGKVRIVNWSMKDPNELLVAGKSFELRDCINSASVVRPDSIVSVSELKDQLAERPKRGLSWPWQSLTDCTYGIQMHQIYTIGAGSGIGKTEFLKDIMLDLAFRHGEKVGAMFLEQKPSQTLLRLVGGLLGRRLHVPGDYWDVEEIMSTACQLEDKVYFYDHFGGQDIDVIMSKIRYFVKGLGCKYIILDHLTALAASMKDERKGIDLAMAKIGSLVQELDCTIFLVSHLAKPMEGLSYEEGRIVTASAFRGSQSIQYWSSFMIGLERNKLSEDESERIVTKVRILKDRFSGEADGVTFPLIYNRSSGKLEEFVL